MTDASDSQRDFFISFNKADREAATWIAWVLEKVGSYKVYFQDWDFRGNFVDHMNEGIKKCPRCIAVLSDNYFGSEFTLAEWSAFFARDPALRRATVIPVRVGPISQDNLLSPAIYADLTDCDEETAEKRLLDHVLRSVDPTFRPVPATRPPFWRGQDKPPFPHLTKAAAIHNLPPCNPDFVGREAELEKLLDLLAASEPVVLTQVITGLGGVGKTQAALAYAHRHLAECRLVWWLRAEQAATLAADYAAMAGHLGIPETADQPKQVEAVRHALEDMEGWLLVFDNVEDPAVVRNYFPRRGDGRVLLTSRRTDWRGIAKALPLDVLPEDDAVLLLLGRAEADAAERAEAKALASELGYLPLALAQASAYMAETGRSLADYRRLLRASRPAVLARGKASADCPASVAKTWQISIEAAEDACAAARPLLELLAFFSADPLPMAVLGTAPAALPEELRDELERDEAIAALHRFSLIRAEAGSMAAHRLVQAVTRDGLDEARAKTCAEAAVRLVSAALPRLPQEHTNWPAFGALLPHALATAKAAAQFGAGLEAAARVFNNTALYHHSRAAWGEAEPLYGRALAVYEEALGPEHPHVATSLNNLAGLYQDTGRLAKAEPLYQRAIAIGEKTLGPEHPTLATWLNNLADLYRATSRYAEAEPLFQRVLAIFEKALGAEHPYVATSLNNLAELYRATARYAEAEPLFKRAIAIGEKTLGPEHPTLATYLNNLALLYQATGRDAEAESLYQRAIAILEKTLPPDHPHLMRGRENYAILLDQLGRHGEAAAIRAQAHAGRGGSPAWREHGPGSQT